MKIFARLARWLWREESPRPITARSSLENVLEQYPDALDFLAGRYGVTPTAEERRMPLERLAKKLGLPPAQILYMQIQMDVRDRAITRLGPREAQSLVARPETRILDVREEWETRLARLPRAERLDERLLGEMVSGWPKDTPLLLYCHHGVRSGDAASFLAELGFTAVHVLEGGIDGWSATVDPSVRRYEGNPC